MRVWLAASRRCSNILGWLESPRRRSSRPMGSPVLQRGEGDSKPHDRSPKIVQTRPGSFSFFVAFLSLFSYTLNSLRNTALFRGRRGRGREETKDQTKSFHGGAAVSQTPTQQPTRTLAATLLCANVNKLHSPSCYTQPRSHLRVSKVPGKHGSRHSFSVRPLGANTPNPTS